MKLNTYTIGQGEPLLFLAAANSPFNYYRKLFKVLSRKYSIYFFDYPGINDDTDLSSSPSLELYFDCIDFILNKYNLRSFHLAGVSFGGLLAIEYLHHRKPSGVQSLILFSPLTKALTTSKTIIALRTFLTQLQNWNAESSSLTQNVFTFKQFSHLKGKRKHSELVLRLKFSKDHLNRTLPTLLILGGKDRLIDSAYTLKVFKRLPNVQIIYFKNGSHDAHATIGAEILSILFRFTSLPNKP